MSATPPQARHDLYRHIHKGLRAAMFDAVLQLGRVDPGDADALTRALDQALRLLALVASHIKHENNLVHCAIEARRPAGASGAAEEHRDHLDSLHALNVETLALRAALEADRASLVHRLYRHLAVFAAEQLLHMHREESQTNEVLWALYSDTELEELHQRLLASVEPQVMQQARHWMALALNPQELAQAGTDPR